MPLFQALNIRNIKVSRGPIELTSPLMLVKKGEQITPEMHQILEVLWLKPCPSFPIVKCMFVFVKNTFLILKIFWREIN